MGKVNAEGKGSDTYYWTIWSVRTKKILLYKLPEQLENNDNLFPDTKTVVQIWQDFATLYKLIGASTAQTENLLQDVFTKSKEFMELFCSLSSARIGYNKARVSPYMHALIYHLPIFLRDHGSLKQFTGQGVEKKR